MSDTVYEMISAGIQAMYPSLRDQSKVGKSILRRIKIMQDHIREQRQYFETLEAVREMWEVAKRLIDLGDDPEAVRFLQERIRIIAEEENEYFRKKYAIVALESKIKDSILEYLSDYGRPILRKLLELADKKQQ